MTSKNALGIRGKAFQHTLVSKGAHEDTGNVLTMLDAAEARQPDIQYAALGCEGEASRIGLKRCSAGARAAQCSTC